MEQIVKIIDRIEAERDLSLEDLRLILETKEEEDIAYLAKRARARANDIYGNQVYIRGLIEFTNYCRNDCYYCGIRRSNSCAERYRLTKEQIMECCDAGYELGFRTYVLQGGEDPYFTDERSAIWCQRLRSGIRIAASDIVHRGKKSGQAIRHIITPVPSAICCGMRQRMRHITESCIHRRCP